jgi:hypothetical protein
MTGRGVGLCCVVDASANSTIGKGCRRGLGCIDNQGYGYGSIGIKRALPRRRHATAKEFLLTQKEQLEKDLDAINAELDKI